MARKTATSNTYRFFVPPATIQGDLIVSADAELSRQLATVLRLRPGDQIVLLDGTGQQYTVALAQMDKRGFSGSVLERVQLPPEPAPHITIYAPIIRAERFEWLLQKATELGAAAIVPLVSERTVAGDTDTGQRKHERWLRIVREAAEQSRRAVLPVLAATQPFAIACRAAEEAELALLLWEWGDAPPMRAVVRQHTPARVALLSGPEGGLTDAERATAADRGIHAVSLGPRTLRAETAPLAALAALRYEYD